ncbi:D-amino-acid transaminase [Kordiimonas pumila]|uniref:Probable branched-chain-amino-acid aminotransferase n=1 Tax=Kordiimonas pumila TaxID=2161677 RepID=A0ABV7D5L6_9PROT|nr:D-amino-acid transaminase [Kordiimonas pumila]
MSRIAYVNGAYLPMDTAFIHIEDRANQFADAVYEVVTVYNGRFIDMDAHIDRLERSLNELHIQMPMARSAMMVVLAETARKNRATNAILYIQVSRGIVKRDHAFPVAARPCLTVTCRRFDFAAVKARAEKGIKTITTPDIRWGRCDIKSTSLLPNVLAKQAAKEQGAAEAIMLDEAGNITEGSSTNVWMVTKDGVLVTRSIDDNILPGITRAAVMTIARDFQIKIEERAFSLAEAQNAAEMFLTSSTNCAMPIIMVDTKKIGDGKPGSTTKRIVDAYWSMMEKA